MTDIVPPKRVFQPAREEAEAANLQASVPQTAACASSIATAFLRV